MCEGIKLIREKMEKTINTSAGRKEEQMLFQITSVHVKKKAYHHPTPPAELPAQSSGNCRNDLK